MYGPDDIPEESQDEKDERTNRSNSSTRLRRTNQIPDKESPALGPAAQEAANNTLISSLRSLSILPDTATNDTDRKRKAPEDPLQTVRQLQREMKLKKQKIQRDKQKQEEDERKLAEAMKKVEENRRRIAENKAHLQENAKKMDDLPLSLPKEDLVALVKGEVPDSTADAD
jgi:hypothetical protein